jgi:cysteine sulfinate desulfinase/cysteine desulfurase-like protein
MSRFTEESDIDYVAEVMNRVLPRLRRMAAKQVS